MLESGSAPVLVAPQRRAPRDDRDAWPGITMAGLLPSVCSAHNAPWSSPQLRQPHEGPQVGLSPGPASHPTAHPAGTLRSPARSTAPAQPRSLRPQRLPTSAPLPAGLSSTPQFPLLEMGADRRAGAFGRAAGDGVGSSGTPQPPLLRKARGTAQSEGLARVPPPRGRCCRGAKAGGSGARQGRTNGAGKSAGPGDSSLAGEGGRAAERGMPWHAAQSCLCASPSPPRPAGKRHRVAFWGRLAAGVGSPCHPGGLGSCPAGWGGSTLGPRLAEG